MGLFDAEAAKGSLIEGCLMGYASQLIFFALGVLASHVFKGSFLVYLAFGITQWIALVPLILSSRKKKHQRTTQGLIITGCIGLLLCSACAGIIMPR